MPRCSKNTWRRHSAPARSPARQAMSADNASSSSSVMSFDASIRSLVGRDRHLDVALAPSFGAVHEDAGNRRRRCRRSAMMMVASALMSGVTPSLTLLQIRIGSVVVPGPVVKLVMTTSSSEMVKARSQPDRMAGRDHRQGDVASAPARASSPDPSPLPRSTMSIDDRRDCTMVVT